MSGPQRPLSQQFPPREPVVKDEPIARDQLIRKSTRHEPLPEKTLPRTSGPRSGSRRPEAMDRRKGASDLPADQPIPLDELPRDERPSSSPPLVVIDDQPLLRPPKRRKTDKSKPNGYDGRTSLCIGIVLIIIGICEIILNIMGIIMPEVGFYPEPSSNIVFHLAPGLWCSVFFILCGTFGILSANRQETWTIVTHLVVSTLASMFACILLALSSWAVFLEIDGSQTRKTAYSVPSLIVLCLMICGGILAVLLTVTASAICCRFMCRRPLEKTSYDNLTSY